MSALSTRLAGAVVLSIALLAQGLSRPASAEDLAGQAQALLESTLARENLAGMTAGIAQGDRILWLGAAGFRDVENKIPAAPDMVNRIASISKPMTAVAVMQLVDYGRIDLQDPLRKFVPAWPETPGGEIQIIHLLTHTSGVKHYTGTDNRPFDHHASLQEAVESIMNRRHAFPPGDRYLYTTYGYTTLGLVIERASGLSYEDYMRDYVWLPAGMRHTSLEDRSKPEPETKSKLYRRNGDGEIEEDEYTDLSVKYPGGGIQSTAGDILRFAIAFENERLLPRARMEQMMTIPQLSNPRTDERPQYGSGWGIGETDGLGALLYHSGGQSGTATYLLICRDTGIAAAVLCNTSETGAPKDLAFALARLAAGLPAETSAAE